MSGTPIRRSRPPRDSVRSSPGVGASADSLAMSNHSDMMQSGQAAATAAAYVPRSSEASMPLEALAVAFWGSRLRARPFHDGDQPMEYDSLWPSGGELKRAVQDFNESELEYAMLDCCRLTVLCGPVRVLREMVEAKIVGVDQMFQPHGVTLLHMACVAQLPDMVSMLLDNKASNKKDLLGRPPQEVCRDRATRDRFPASLVGIARRVSSRGGGSASAVAKAIAKSEVFQMATEPMKNVELLIQIQKLDFDVNFEKDEDGNYLVHIVTECGISQMPTLLCLHRLCKADFDIYNDDGLTPLCIAAENGSLNLIELLVCVLGASPNKPNSITGWTPLHYAASQCHPEAVLALIRRGALVNLECKSGSLPDDVIPRSSPAYRETLQLLRNERRERMERLTQKARNGSLHWSDVHNSDQFVINDSGNTLLMEACLYDRSSVVSLLCGLEQAPINAQHFKTGQTALAICAAGGNVGSLQQLLKHGADPRIVDIEGKIPLHHACTWRTVDCIDELVKQKNGLYGLTIAKQYTQDTRVEAILQEAQKRRQDEIIKPMLFECVASGEIELIGAFEWEQEDDVNVENSYSESPMLLAAQNGHVDIVRMLYKLGGKVNQISGTSGNTPLHAACKYGRLPVVEFLLNFTTSPSMPGAAGQQTSGGEKLLDINHRDSYGHTPLELAVSQGHARIIDRLCKRGASCTLPDSSGQLLSSRQFMGVQVMLRDFRRQHMKQIVATFSKRREFPRLKQLWMSPHDHSLRNENEESPLMVACSCVARMEVINFLLSDITPRTPSVEELTRNRPASETIGLFRSPERDQWRSSTPVPGMLSPRSGESTPESEKKLRRKSSHGPYMTPTTRPDGKKNHTIFEEDENQASPPARRKLNFNGDSDSVKSDASPRVKPKADSSGFDSFLNRPPSPIDVSVLEADDSQDPLSPNGSELSLSAGSLHSLSTLPWREPLNDLLLAQGRDGGTALHRATAASFSDAAKALLEADPRIVNIPDNRGNSPLHLACILKQTKIIKLLLKCPTVILNQQNCDFQLPEDVAPRSLSKEINNKRMALTSGVVKRYRRTSAASRPNGIPISPSATGPYVPSDGESARGASAVPGTPEGVDSFPEDIERLEEQFRHLKDSRNGGRTTPKPAVNGGDTV